MRNFTPSRRLTGGIRLPANKRASTAAPIRQIAVPAQIIVSTRQHAGKAALPIVEVGQRVMRGDTIARADVPDAADVHAPTSGTVVALEPHAAPLPTGVTTEIAVVIESDGRNLSAATELPQKPDAATTADLQQLSAAGIVGLGGAAFPAATKVNPESNARNRCLIVNGAECEPYISCDDMLMREAPEEVLQGAAILRDLIGAEECIVAIERDKPEAIDAISAAADRLKLDGFSLAELPSTYPAGGERQLVDVLGSIEIPDGRYPSDHGFVCQNVGTCRAVYRHFRLGEPLTSRVVTVTGSAIRNPGNVEAPIGTPIADLIAACGGYLEEPVRLIHGGSMMGYAITTDALPITKASNCIVAATASELSSADREWPCIRCGECGSACPARLQPQELLVAARSRDARRLDEFALSECIECGCCDIVCPSHIPLTAAFQDAKLFIEKHARTQQLSEVADRRFQLREQRQSATEAADERRREVLKRTLKTEDGRAAMIAAAVERARRQKTDADTDDA